MQAECSCRENRVIFCVVWAMTEADVFGLTKPVETHFGFRRAFGNQELNCIGSSIIKCIESARNSSPEKPFPTVDLVAFLKCCASWPSREHKVKSAYQQNSPDESLSSLSPLTIQTTRNVRIERGNDFQLDITVAFPRAPHAFPLSALV